MSEHRKNRKQKSRQNTVTKRPFGSLKLPYQPLEILNQDQINDIHDATMRILETIGISLLDQRSRDMMKNAGAKVVDGIVRFDLELICSLIKTAPSQFAIRGRNAAKRMTIGDGHTVFSSVV
ncbi:MAG: hypothetical protein HOH19_12300 [Kordiimonadaceae bacterium]|nr:hypothetical protein [Kordiimonadaceae bacterium]